VYVLVRNQSDLRLIENRFNFHKMADFPAILFVLALRVIHSKTNLCSRNRKRPKNNGFLAPISPPFSSILNLMGRIVQHVAVQGFSVLGCLSCHFGKVAPKAIPLLKGKIK